LGIGEEDQRAMLRREKARQAEAVKEALRLEQQGRQEDPNVQR